LLNYGLLTPQEVLDEILYVYQRDNTHLPSVEGLIRQIIGWREFIRGCYHTIDYSQDMNFFDHHNSLTEHWYTGTTGIDPLDDSILKAQDYGYTHHIERLMIIGNCMLLAEVRPQEVYRWFMEMFIDSADWVMAPNIFSMSQFSDGGLQYGGFATKPYIAGSNYIRKMSHYPKGDWCDTMDGLYWRFIDKKRDFFQQNPRMAIMTNMYDKFTDQRKQSLHNNAEKFIWQTCQR
jgi:deoxyribodipyrimidine photolyase-related protein